MAEAPSSMPKPIPGHVGPRLGCVRSSARPGLWTQRGLRSPDTVRATPAQHGRPKVSGASPCSDSRGQLGALVMEPALGSSVGLPSAC